MAIQSVYTLKRNTSLEDSTTSTFDVRVIGYDEQTGEFTYASTPEGGLPSVEDLEWSNSGYVFKEWNTVIDGSGASFSAGEYPPADGVYDSGYNIFAIWEEPTPEPDPDPAPETTKYLVDATDLTSVANAIRAKSGKTAPLSFPTEFVNAVDSFSVELKDVQFIDYDGTILYSYTPQEFAQLTELPPNPTHEGLTAQGWNWPLAEAKSYVASYGKLIVGQMYITDDGKTRLYITLEEGRLSPYLGLAVNGTAVIDWGDGSNLETITGTSLLYADIINTRHNYAVSGSYVIAVGVVSGSVAFIGSSNGYSKVLHSGANVVDANRCYYSAVKNVQLGDNIYLKEYAFASLQCLKTVTVPMGGVSMGSYVFKTCYSLKAAVLPTGMDYIGYSSSIAGVFNASGLEKVSLPYGLKTLNGSAFHSCYTLKDISVPSTVTTIGASAFYTCYGLRNLVLPEGITGIAGDAFYTCRSLSTLSFPSTLKSFGERAIMQCSSLEELVLPNSVTSINTKVFYACRSMRSLVLSNQISTISTEAFCACSSLSHIILPRGVTTIKSKAFFACYCLGEIHFEGATPPTVENADAWNNVPTDCTIYVPSSEDHSVLNAYKTAANYPDPNTYTYVEE